MSGEQSSKKQLGPKQKTKPTIHILIRVPLKQELHSYTFLLPVRYHTFTELYLILISNLYCSLIPRTGKARIYAGCTDEKGFLFPLFVSNHPQQSFPMFVSHLLRAAWCLTFTELYLGRSTGHSNENKEHRNKQQQKRGKTDSAILHCS